MSSSDPALIAGLRKALGRPLPLQSNGKVDGVFLAGQGGKPLAERAKQEEWIEELTEKQSVTTTNPGLSYW